MERNNESQQEYLGTGRIFNNKIPKHDFPKDCFPKIHLTKDEKAIVYYKSRRFEIISDGDGVSTKIFIDGIEQKYVKSLKLFMNALRVNVIEMEYLDVKES